MYAEAIIFDNLLINASPKSQHALIVLFHDEGIVKGDICMKTELVKVIIFNLLYKLAAMNSWIDDFTTCFPRNVNQIMHISFHCPLHQQSQSQKTLQLHPAFYQPL